jgi:hypothetical protein
MELEAINRERERGGRTDAVMAKKRVDQPLSIANSNETSKVLGLEPWTIVEIESLARSMIQVGRMQRRSFLDSLGKRVYS